MVVERLTTTNPEASGDVGMLDSDDWAIAGFSDGDLPFGGSWTIGDYARGTSLGGVATGGIYAFDTGGGDIMLGVQPVSTDFNPGTMTFRFLNLTGTTLSELDLSYNIWTNNDGDRASSLNFSFSVDDSTYVNIPALDFATPAARGRSFTQPIF